MAYLLYSFALSTAVDTSACMCPWMAGALRRGTFAVLPDGTIPHSELVHGLQRAKVDGGANHLLASAGIRSPVDARTCGGSSRAHYHLPPSGIRPWGGPPNATRFDEIMHGIGANATTAIDADLVLRFAQWVVEHPTVEVQEAMRGVRPLEFKGFPLELSLANYVRSIGADGELQLTYAEFRAGYVDGVFPDRVLSPIDITSSSRFFSLAQTLQIYVVKWYERAEALMTHPLPDHLRNIAGIGTDLLESMARDASGLIRRR